MSYLLIGAGGTGSIIAPHLARHLRKTHPTGFALTIVDGDKVSERNTGRQDYLRDHIGANKADILAARINATPVCEYIDQSSARRLIRENDTVIIAVDNYRARADIERRALELSDVTVINGGNEANTASCQIFMRRAGENVTPPLSYQHPEILTPGLTRGQLGCMAHADDPEDDQTIAANLMSAAWMMAALYHLANIRQGLHRRLTMDETTGLLDYSLDPIWHETHADLSKGIAGGPDWRDMGNDAWRDYIPPAPAEHTEIEITA